MERFKRILDYAYNKLLGDENDDESSDDNISESSHDVQPVKPILGRAFNRLNQSDSINIELNNRDQNSITLHNRTDNINQSSQVHSLKNDLDLIGQNVFELNSNLNRILAENEQQKFNEKENSNLLYIKQNIGNNLKFLNEKFNSLSSTSSIDNQLIPVLSSTLNQLEIALQKVKSTINDDVIPIPELAINTRLLDNKLNSVIESNECLNNFILDLGLNEKYLEIKFESIEEIKTNEDSNINLQLAIYSQLLEEKVDKLQKIFYKRHQAKLEEFFIKLKLKYKDDFENFKQRNRFQFELVEYSKYCVKSNKPNDKLRILFREKFKNDLKFKHDFHLFLLKYEKNLFQLVLNESKRYIPQSDLFIDCLSNDIKYNLYVDIDQLKLIYQFLIDVYHSDNISKFYDLVKIKTSSLNLFYNHIKDLKHANKEYYLNLLKESYLVFVKDFILNLNEEDENTVESDEDIKLIFNQIKIFNEENLKLIHDSEKNMKNSFIRQFRGKYSYDKLILDEIESNEYKITQLSIAKDVQLDELKSKWLETKNSDKYSKYENYVVNMKDSVKKSANLFEISQIYKAKKPSLKLYLKKSIKFLNQSISIDKFIISSSNIDFDEMSNKRIQLRNKYELRALIHLELANRYDYPCWERLNYFNNSKYDFNQFNKLITDYENIEFNEKNFLYSFKKTFSLNNDLSIESYEKILKINPYFFEAQYQQLLKFYELNDCGKICHFHESFNELRQSDRPIADLFKILINLKKCLNTENHKSLVFRNKILKIKVKNNQKKSLYLKFVKTEFSYQLKFNNEEQLINLLKYGKINMIEMKNNSNKSLKLKYQLSNSDFKQLINHLSDKIQNQIFKFSELITFFKKLELVNEIEYKKLDKKFLILLPETRFNLIKSIKNSNDCHSICEISKSIKEFKNFFNHNKLKYNEINQKIIQLKFERAQIYRRNNYFYLEELELLDILNYQKTSADHNPIIYYRLSYLYHMRGDLQMSINYISLASKKYNEKINKKIFKKIENLKSKLYQLENTKIKEIPFINRNQMNLIQIFNIINKVDFNLTLSIQDSFQLFQQSFKNNKTNALINCLFYHLIDEDNDIEEYLDNNNNNLTQKYKELQNKFKNTGNQIEEERLIEEFNVNFSTKFKCLFIKEDNNSTPFSYEKDEIPIILLKDQQSSTYTTTKKIHHYILLNILTTTYNAKADLKLVCSKFLNDEISKNILRNNNENKNIETFMNSMAQCENIKIFIEEVIYLLKSDIYDKRCFNFWSLIADLDYNIDLKDSLNYFKELFIESIEEYKKEKEEQHKSALELIENLIEQNENKQKYFNLLNKLLEEILKSLSIYGNVSPKSERRKKLIEIVSSNYEIDEKLKQMISSDCFNINLQFKDTNEEEGFFEYLKNNRENEILILLLSIIENSLLEPNMNINGPIITVKSYNIFLSDLIEDLEKNIEKSNIQEIRFYGTNIFVNISLNKELWYGINLIFASDIIDFVKDELDNKITINVSGKLGQNGKNAEHQTHATRESENGLDGLPGENGEAGGNGGNIYFIANKELKGKINIEKLITSGGDGGKGGKGGNAGNGCDGKNGEHATEANWIGFGHGFYLTCGEKGTPGGDGGKGGDAGLGGCGGHAGIIHIEEDRHPITHTFANIIESKDISNTNGEDGLPGEGGKGGDGGYDGNDILYHKRHSFTRNKKYVGHIKLLNQKKTLFTLDVDIVIEKKPKQSNGVNNVHGKSADVQLKSGKTRNKREEKEKSDEQQIKSQLNEVINNNTEETNNISNNITNSINLLKDQMNDITDERKSMIKTHELSNSLIENAHTIAQQALALNAIKVNSKVENKILKTSDNDNNKSDKLLIQLKLSIDKDNKQEIQFEKTNFILENLKKHYSQEKKDELIKQLDKNIVAVKTEIKSLKLKGKHIIFKVDIESFKSSYLISQNKTNEFNLLRLTGDINDEILLNQDLSLLTKNYESISYDPKSQQYEPFLLNEYFEKLNNFKDQKKLLIRIRNKFQKFNIHTFINELCLEYGNEELINKKLFIFDNIIQLNNFEQWKNFELFNMKIFLKENNFLIDELINYKNYLNEFFTNKSMDLIYVDKMSKLLIESNISIERIKQSEHFLLYLFDIFKEKKIFKQFQLIECTPIYHDSNQLLNVHLIEELLNQFLQSKDKNIDILARIFKCFIEIVENNEYKIFCQKKIKNFLEFLSINLVYIRIDFKQGYLLNIMKKDLHSIQINYSSSLFHELFDRLKLIILIRENQFNKLNNSYEKIKIYFQNKQNDIDFEVQVINYIRKTQKCEIRKFFQNYPQTINENIQEFLKNFYFDDKFKFKIQIILGDFEKFLKNIKEFEYKFIIEEKKNFFNNLKLFLKKRKKNINTNDLTLQKDKCENMIYLLYKNINLQTNIQFLNDMNISEELDVNVLIKNLTNFYEQLRLENILYLNKEKNEISRKDFDFNEIDYNKKIGEILLISREMKHSDEIQIQNGYMILILKENANQFRIYFRDNHTSNIRNYLLNENNLNLINILNERNFNRETMLSKENEQYIFKMIYKEVELQNGFTKYSIEQIESFEKLKELVHQTLFSIKNHLDTNIYQYIISEINDIYNSELPSHWSQRIHRIFYNINIITKIKNQLNLSTSIEIERLDLTNPNIMTILNEFIEDLLKENKEDILIIFYKSLSIYDYLLIKIKENQLNISDNIQIQEIAQNLSKKFDPKNPILYEIVLKNNELLKECYFNEILKIFNEKKNEILNDINSSLIDLDIQEKEEYKKNIELHFKDFIRKNCLLLFNYIDNIYLKSFKELNLSIKYEIYSKLIPIVKDFNTNIKFDSNKQFNILEISISFFDYLAKQCLIFISGLNNIQDQLNENRRNEILNNFTVNNKILEKCSLRMLSSQSLEKIDEYQNEIILNKISKNEIKIIYQHLIDHRRDFFILKKDQYEILFNSLNTVTLIDDNQFDDYEQLYSLIQIKNGIIYKNQKLFDEVLFIEIFINQVMKNVKNLSKETLKEYFNSFKIILQNFNINFEILDQLNNSYENFIQNEKDDDIFNEFDFLIYEKYQYLINNIEQNFNNLILKVKYKNRLLNIILNYFLKYSKEIKFEKNQLLNITLEIKTILQTNQLRIHDIVYYYEQLNKALIQTPCNCLQIFQNQLKSLKMQTRLFIENIDFSKDCQIKKAFYDFNEQLRQTESIDNQSICNLLNNVLKNNKSIDVKNYKYIMKKILVNLKINNEKFDLKILEIIENNIKICETNQLIKKEYLKFIIETIQTQLNLKYNEKLNEYQEMKKNINNSIKELVDLFWSNISMSDLLNKEREKTYFHLNIEKLLNISNVDNEKEKLILDDLLNQLKQLQMNSNKKQFVNDIHKYLNNQINRKLNESESLILTDEIKKIFKKNSANEDNSKILDELSILFEKTVDNFNNKLILNEFFQSFENIFKYFSWRLTEYESKSIQEMITKAIERFTASIKTFKDDKISKINIEERLIICNHFYQFEKNFYLHTQENQLQEELNHFHSQTEEKLKTISKIIKTWLKTLDNSISKTDQSSVSIGKGFFDKINELFVKDDTNLNDFYFAELKNEGKYQVENENIDHSQVIDSSRSNIPEEISNEQMTNIKMSIESKFSILNQFSLDIINQEKQWDKKKDLIKKFDLMKQNMFENYLKSIYKEKSDPSINFETFKNSIEIKHYQEIITQSNVNEWKQEINDLSIDLFIINLLKLYNFHFDTLKIQYNFIERKLSNNKQDDDNDDILNNLWQSELKQNHNSNEIIDFIIKYSKEETNEYNSQISLDGLIKKFLEQINSIKNLKFSIDTLYFFVGYENFLKLIKILEIKLINSQLIQMDLNKLTNIFYLLSNLNDFNQALEILENFNVENWFLYLNLNKIQYDLNMLFHRYLDELNFNDLIVKNLDCLDEVIESKLNQIEIEYEKSLKKISNILKMIELNKNMELMDKEIFFNFLKSRLIFELQKDSNYLISLNDLETIFNKYLVEANILNRLIYSLKNESADLNDNDENNDELMIESISSKSFSNLLPYLTRFWIIEQLELNKKAEVNEKTKIIQYFELIKTSYSEEKMFQLIAVIKETCEKTTIIPQTIIDLLMNIANNEWILDNEIIKIIKTIQINQLEEEIENYMKEKRSKERDLTELIHLMQEDKNNLNNSIKDYLTSETILDDLKLLINNRSKPIDPEITNESVENWTKKDIQKWSKKVKSDKLLLNKEYVQNAIVVVSQAIYLFTYEKSGEKKKGFYPRETQLIALWLFLNPDLNRTNMGCLGQISTGEGKSIIVAALAAIKALGCHRIDIITSSSVLAIRDAEEFRTFFQMFNLQISNNCDSLCEQGDGKQSSEEIRKLRYYNQNGPVDIIYGECSCFERDILLTEFNRNDPKQNIISQRITKNSIPSIIIDEVDSMLLDKANMVLYLSHNIDTLKSLERVFISIWQTINQQMFDYVNRNILNDDLIQLVSDMIFEQIDNKNLDIPEYDTGNCDYINMKLFIKRRMSIWIKSAFHVKDMIPNDTYIISRDQSSKSSDSEIKITVMDKDTGTEQLSTRWSNGVHQFLQLKHSRRLTPESLKAVFISNMSFFKRYKNHIIGLTGSLGSIDEQNLLNKIYHLRFFQLPRFKQELFRELKGNVNTLQENWLENIKNALDREIKFKFINKDKRRAVLIICENVKSVLILQEYLSNSYSNAKVYKSAYEKFEIHQLNPGDIIIATNLAGRGTDLDTSNKLEENGGLHVITTYLPTNIRIEMQAFGRTARKGNKGTGEYIILSQYGLSIEDLKQLRNNFEKERLDLFLVDNLPKIKIEEDLLQGFEDEKLSCIGFTKLYQNIEEKLSNDFSIRHYGNEYKQFQLYSLKNRWAFWLDSMTEHINMINTIGKQKIIEKFNEFQLTIEKDIAANNFKKLIIEPTELIKLGRYYRDKENWSYALLCYKEASKDKFYSVINYYTSSCYQNRNYANGLQSKKELKHNLINVKSSIEKEIQILNTAAQLAFEIDEKNRKLGFANYGNEYDRQVKEKSTIWNIFSTTITNIIGCSIDSKDLQGNKYLCDDKNAKELFEKLQNKEFIKPCRITKKTIEKIDLPSIFNTDLIKKPLIKYLNNKSNERKTKLSEFTYEIFQKDLKKLQIFLPYSDAFINLIKNHGFIQEIINNEKDQLYLFQNFNEEKFDKKNFNFEIILFDWLKEISKDREFTGTKNDILNKIKEFLSSKNVNNISQNQMNIFYEYLLKNSYLEKLNQYSVQKDKIIKMKEDKYQYSNFYDFERHYTNEFQNFDLIFRNNFLKIILLEKDDSYFTLKDTINSNDFELLKTEDDAINYLWNYLKSTPYIKEPKINIGLINSKEVNVKRNEIKNEIKKYFNKKLSDEEKKELDEAVNTVFNLIDQTIGELKKIPDDKTIANYLQIKTTYFLDNNKNVPEALEEFIELALDVVFRLEEKKEPPKWYEIAIVVTLGVIQVVGGVLAKMFIPFAGQLIGEFLISTGCDDILFGVQCAITGEFSWEKYWQHKKQSMITSAMSAVFFSTASYLKNVKRLKSFEKAWGFQKLTGAGKLRTAASALGVTANIGKHIGKEITKTLVQTGLAELASIGIDNLLDQISMNYEMQLNEKIKESIIDKWEMVQVEMKEIFRLSEGNDLSTQIIDDCIKRKLENLPEATMFKNFASHCGPIMQGLGRVLADRKGVTGTLQRIFTTYAPSLIKLGVNLGEIAVMIGGFLKNLANDLKDARKKLTKTNKQYELTEVKIKKFEQYQNDKINQISKQLSETFNRKLKSGIIAPILNFAANRIISKRIESIAGADRTEYLANTFELIHAASNPDDTKFKYADDLRIFLTQARPVNINDIKIDLENIPIENLHGKSLQQAIGVYGDKTKVFIDRNGKYYIRRPSSKEYYQSIQGDKPAGLHEQQKIQEILGCDITKDEMKDNEQKCTLKREGGLDIEFVIKDNDVGIKHAEIIVDGKSINIDTNSGNKNDCFYNVALVVNEMSQGKSFDEARKILDDSNKVKELRKDVSLAMKNDEKLLNELRWTNKTDINSHIDSLTGLHVDTTDGKFKLDVGDEIAFREYLDTKENISKFKSQTGGVGENDAGEKVPRVHHHKIPKCQILSELKAEISTLDDASLIKELETYLNDPRNAELQEHLKHQLQRFPNRTQSLDAEFLVKAVLWNPNNLVPGPPFKDPNDKKVLRKDPKHKIDTEILSSHDKTIVYDLTIKILEKISQMNPPLNVEHTWYKDKSSLFIYKPNSQDPGGYKFPQ